MSTPYTLEGRILEDSEGEAPCIFCGKVIKHINEDGIGWIVGALVNDKSEEFLVCEQPHCDARNKAEEGVDENTPENKRVVWRCTCVSDYVENVGPLCSSCRKPPNDRAWRPD